MPLLDLNTEFSVTWDGLKPVTWAVNQDDFTELARWVLQSSGRQ